MAKTKKRTQTQRDALVLLAIPVVASVLSLLLQVNFLVATILFFGLPAIWLSIKCASSVKKALIFSLLLAIPVSILVDYIGVTNGSWYVPESIFANRLFGVVPYEDLLWGFLLVYNPVMFYERFFCCDNKRKSSIGKLIVMSVLFALLLISLALAVGFRPDLIIRDYAYFWMGVILLLAPVVIFISIYPKFIKPFLITGIYFFLIGVTFELTGVELGHWIFPGTSTDFIGWVTIFNTTIPFEEFFFWFVVQSSSALTYYLVFDNDTSELA